jgi:drug/metabolite transporter (DMT)-like permease
VPAPARSAHAALVAAAFLFGTTFVVVKDAVADVEPVPFLAVRFAIGTVALLPFARRAPASPGLVRSGLWCGSALVAGYVLQTVGLQYTTASVSAFITYLLIVFVPLIGAVRLRRRPEVPTLAGVALALGGLWLLTGARPSAGRGELLTLGCALAFALHVVFVAEHAPRHAALRLNAVQLAVVSLGCAVPGLFMGGYHFTVRAWLAAAWTGLFASAGALGLQVWAQARVEPGRAALVLTLEPVFAALLGWATGEHLGAAGVAGGALILAGVLVSELGPWPRPLQPEAPS